MPSAPNDDGSMQNYAASIDPGLRAVQAASEDDREANPFNPGFGVRPPIMAGRHGVINEILVRLSRGPGRHEFITVVAGARGVGKTVLLADIGEHVREENRLTMTWNAGLPLAEALDEQGPGVERRLAAFFAARALPALRSR